MRKDEIIDRNISLTFDFLRQVVKNPKLIDDIPNGSAIEFVQKDIPIRERQTPRKKMMPTRYFRVHHQFEKV